MFKSLQNKNFRLFFLGQTVSLTGTWLQITAMPWLVYRLTNSVFLLGFVGFLSQIFILVLSPFAGAAADHYDRKKIFILTQIFAMIQALALGLLTLSGKVQLWQILVLVTMIGVINAFDMPTRQSFLADMVEKKDLMNAIGLNSLIFNGARMIGPAIAGILIASFGEGICFVTNGLSFIPVIIALFFIKISPVSDGNNEVTIRRKFMLGIEYVRSTKYIAYALLLLSTTSLTAIFPMTLMPVIVKDIYKLGPSGLGIFMSAMGIGALIGTIRIASRKSSIGLEKVLVYSALSLGALIIIFSFIKNIIAASFLLSLIGYFIVLQMGTTNIFIQLKIPDDMRGRIMGLFVMAFMGFAPLGSLLAGFLAHQFNVPFTMAFGGSLSLVAALILNKRIIADETFIRH